MNRIFLLIVCTFISCSANSQNLRNLEKMDGDYQNCLDKGIHMEGCSIEYYAKVDSLLNVIYKKIRLNLNSSQKEALKKEQLKWLRKRDSYFDIISKKITKEGGSNTSDDYIMKYNDKKYLFVYDRVEELIKKYHL